MILSRILRLILWLLTDFKIDEIANNIRDISPRTRLSRALTFFEFNNIDTISVRQELYARVKCEKTINQVKDVFKSCDILRANNDVFFS